MRIKTIVLLGLLFICGSAVGQTPIMHVKPAKNPGAAFVMGLFVPGSGQMYNDQVELGLGIFAVSAGLLVSGAAIYGSPEYSNSASLGGGLMVAGGAISLAGAIHAVFHSRKINRNNGLEPTSSRRSQGLSFGLNGSGVGLAFRF